MISPETLRQRQEEKDAKRDLLIKKLKDAWENAGPHPEYHYKQKALLKQNWSVLHDAIEELINFK